MSGAMPEPTVEFDAWPPIKALWNVASVTEPAPMMPIGIPEYSLGERNVVLQMEIPKDRYGQFLLGLSLDSDYIVQGALRDVTCRYGETQVRFTGQALDVRKRVLPHKDGPWQVGLPVLEVTFRLFAKS